MDWEWWASFIFAVDYHLLYQGFHIKSDTTLATLHVLTAYILPSTPNVRTADIFHNKMQQYLLQAYIDA